MNAFNNTYNKTCNTFRRSFFLLSLVLVSNSAYSAPVAINYITDNRFTVSAGGDGNGNNYNNEYRPSAPFEDWNTSLQSSTLGPDSMSAGGNASAFSDFSWSVDNSTFDVTFELTEAAKIDLSGELGGQNYSWGYGWGEITLTDVDNSTTLFKDKADSFSLDTFLGEISRPFSFTDTLAAGTYRLYAKAGADPTDAYGSYVFTANFTPVPLPASAPLLAVTLIGMLLRIRRRTQVD